MWTGLPMEESIWMEKLRPWHGQPSDRGRLKNGTVKMTLWTGCNDNDYRKMPTKIHRMMPKRLTKTRTNETETRRCVAVELHPSSMHCTKLTTTTSTSWENNNSRRPAGSKLTLQVWELLLRDILASDHVLNNAVHGVQYHLVVAQRQHRVDLGVQQAVSVNRR